MRSSLNIILASKSPRRQELLKLMGFDFKVVLKDVDESFPEGLKPEEVAVFIAEKKARAFDDSITDEVVITSDTIVCINDQILGKPADREEAIKMVNILSGTTHDVITGVSILRNHQIISFYDITKVSFEKLSYEETAFYIDTYQPYDKAGAYGIQEWIGMNKISRIEGSYTNVMGLPTEKLYKHLMALI
ncbi:septum formation protein Maf [Solitalea longa]|uniref:dTTP/UTP pyrophosphatase n=1 Tax=Solitalea longa TaxID=2079460 RepID=A0A2S5A5F8_9SPHI|nr:Maf family nucleotide pyrophosphatase [Solitalea longa]POY37830.1 septum formation protein Maf [Solitalea longa]